MSGEEVVVGVDELFSVEAIAFYIWVFGVAISLTLYNKKAGLCNACYADMFMGMIIASVVAIAIWCWVGPNGVIALAVTFVVCKIVKAYKRQKGQPPH